MKKIICLALAMSLFATLIGCQAESTATPETTAAVAESASTATAAATTAAATTAAIEEKETEASHEPVSITFLHNNPQEERIVVLDGLIQDFQAKYPWITVEQIPMNGTEAMDKIISMAASGKAPNICTGSQSNGQTLVANDLIDFDAIEEVINSIGKDNFYSSTLEVDTADNGRYYGIPWSCWVEGVWINRGMLEEKGFEVGETISWDQILEIAKAFYDPQNQKYGIAIGTEDSTYNEECFSNIAISHAVNLYDKDENIQIDTPEMKESLDFYKELCQYTMPGSNGTTEVRDAFVNQNAPMAIYSTYIISKVVEAGWVDKLDITYLTKEQPVCFGQVTNFMITNQSSEAEREASILFTEYLFECENLIKVLHMAPGGPQPVLNYILDSQEYYENDTIKSFSHIQESINTGVNNIKLFESAGGKCHMTYGAVRSAGAIFHMLYNVVIQDADIEKELKNAQKTAEEIIADL